MKKVILYIVFLYPVICFSQQKVPVPLENYYIDFLLQNDQNSNIDSINWVKEFSRYRERDSIYFYPEYSEIIINSIGEVFGKNFYLLNDSVLIAALKGKIDINCQSLTFLAELQVSDFKRYADAMKLVPTPEIEDQIWHSESRFIVNHYYKQKEFDNGNKYYNLINSISNDYFERRINGKIYSFKQIRNRDSIITAIRELKNNDFKFELYLALIEKLIQVQCSESDLWAVQSSIEDIFIRSGSYSPLQQATIYIAIGKAHNTLRNNSQYAFISFRYAQNILFDNNLYDEHDKLQAIVADFISNQKEEKYLAYLKEAIKPFHAEAAILNNKRNYISLSEYFRRVLRIANYETVVAYTGLKETGALADRRLLIVSGVIYSLSKYINEQEIQKNELFIRNFSILLCDYYRLLLQTKQARQVQQQLILSTVNAANGFIKLKYYEDLKKLSDIERDNGKTNLAKDLYIIVEEAKNEKIDFRPYEDYTFSFPSDYRLWNTTHYKTLIDSLGAIEPFNHSGFKQFLYKEGLENNFWLTPDELLKILGNWAIEQKDWKTAALLLSKLDLAKAKQTDEEASKVFSAAIFGEYLPDKYKKENTIKTLNNYLLIGGIALAIISFLTGWALRERKKAKREEAKSTILAQTMRQIGHLAPQCVNEILDDHKELLGDYLYSKLEKLSGLLQRFYDYSREERITYRQELTLAKDFVDLSYESPRNPHPSSFIAANDKSYSEISQPKYVLFNAIQNAYKYSRKSIFNGGVMSVVISEEGDGYRIRIVNSLDKPKNGKPKPGSGIEYMGKILVNKTKIPKSRLDYGYDQERFYLTYTFKP